MKPARLLRRWALHRSTLILAVSLAGLMASEAGAGGKADPVSQICTGGGQLCNNLATVVKDIPNGGVGQAQFTPGPFTCSNFRIHYFVDGTEVSVTAFVGAGQKTSFVSLGFIGPGVHTIGLQAEGQVSGCNVGTLVSWAGTVKLQKAP